MEANVSTESGRIDMPLTLAHLSLRASSPSHTARGIARLSPTVGPIKADHQIVSARGIAAFTLNNKSAQTRHDDNIMAPPTHHAKTNRMNTNTFPGPKNRLQTSVQTVHRTSAVIVQSESTVAASSDTKSLSPAPMPQTFRSVMSPMAPLMLAADPPVASVVRSSSYPYLQGETSAATTVTATAIQISTASPRRFFDENRFSAFSRLSSAHSSLSSYSDDVDRGQSTPRSGEYSGYDSVGDDESVDESLSANTTRQRRYMTKSSVTSLYRFYTERTRVNADVSAVDDTAVTRQSTPPPSQLSSPIQRRIFSSEPPPHVTKPLPLTQTPAGVMPQSAAATIKQIIHVMASPTSAFEPVTVVTNLQQNVTNNENVMIIIRFKQKKEGKTKHVIRTHKLTSFPLIFFLLCMFFSYYYNHFAV